VILSFVVVSRNDDVVPRRTECSVQAEIGPLPVDTVCRRGQTLHVPDALAVVAGHVPRLEQPLLVVEDDRCRHATVVLPRGFLAQHRLWMLGRPVKVPPHVDPGVDIVHVDEEPPSMIESLHGHSVILRIRVWWRER
jgi:hypothetical protein